MNDKYVVLTKRTHGRFPKMFKARVARGDTNAELHFWVQAHYGMRVSHETIRRWRTVHGNGSNGAR